jgi:hypothetical protein
LTFYTRRLTLFNATVLSINASLKNFERLYAPMPHA